MCILYCTCNSCNTDMSALPDMYTQARGRAAHKPEEAQRPRASADISGKA